MKAPPEYTFPFQIHSNLNGVDPRGHFYIGANTLSDKPSRHSLSRRCLARCALRALGRGNEFVMSGSAASDRRQTLAPDARRFES